MKKFEKIFYFYNRLKVICVMFQKLIRDNKVKRKVKKALEKFDNYVIFATRDEIDDKPYLITDLSKMIDALIPSVSLPCCEVNNVVETLKRVFALTYGNKFEVPKINLL